MSSPCFSVVLSLLIANAVVPVAHGGTKSVAPRPIDENSLYVKPERLAEWSTWRLGLFIHWGPWSESGVGPIWQVLEGDTPEEQARNFDRYKTFNPVAFSPEKWARTAKAAGIKYVVFVAKHHDGFNNWDTALSDYKITSPECPWSAQPNADITRAVVDAFRAEGIAIGLYYSHIDWHHPDGRYFSFGSPDFDESRVDSDPASWERFAAYEKGQLRELLTHYGKIDLIWFDIRWPYAATPMKRIEHPRVRQDVLELLQMMKELQPDIVFDDRGVDVFGGFNTAEQHVPEEGLPGYWESTLTITNGRGFWYKGDQVGAKSPWELVRMLIDIVSKGGNFLMNVGPRPDGEWSPGEYAGLAGVGAWMAVNGESIYGTTKGLFHDLSWGRSTTKGRTLYLHVVDWPEDGRLVLPGLRTPVRAVRWLSKDTSADSALTVDINGPDPVVVTGIQPDTIFPSVIALELAADPVVDDSIRPSPEGDVDLNTAWAEIVSATAAYNYGRNARKGNFIEGLRSTTDSVVWRFLATNPGRFQVTVTYAARQSENGGAFALVIDQQDRLEAPVQTTATWVGSVLDVKRRDTVPGVGAKEDADVGSKLDNTWLFQDFVIGSVELDRAGQHELVLRPTVITGDHLMYLKAVRLVPQP